MGWIPLRTKNIAQSKRNNSMTYIPISPKERDAMLATIGVKTLDDLFKDVPAKHRFPELNLPPALTGMEAAAELADIAASNENVRGDLISFLGAGAYNHYIPSVVDHMLRRGNSIPRILHINRKFRKARFKVSSNINR